jgi:pectate lyase
MKEPLAVAGRFGRLGIYVLAALVLGRNPAASAATGGYADWSGTTNYTTTGGQGGSTTTVTTASAFITAVGSASPGVILFSNSLNLGTSFVDVQSHKTILGLGTNTTLTGNLRLQTATNVIIQNVSFTNPNAMAGDGDGLTVISRSDHIWVDHCSFYNCSDGCFDITRASDFVTVSWCKFFYTSNGGHNNVDLIGHSDTNGSEDAGKLHVTWHHTWWGALCAERMPRVRFGRVHSYNNYFNNSVNGIVTNLYCVRAALESQILVENNFFERIRNPWEAFVTGAGGTTGKISAVNNNVPFLGTSSGVVWGTTTTTVDGTSIIIPGTDTVFAVPYPYTADATNVVAGLVTNSAGAGRVPVALFTASPATGSAPITVTFADASTGFIANRFWDFGDSTTTNTTTNSVSHVYGPGTYTVSLTASGLPGSNTITRSNYIVVTGSSSPPTARFTASSTNGVEPLTVIFADTSTGTPPLNLAWNLGDAFTTNTAGGASFGHTYSAGTYTVMLTATNSAGTSTLVSNDLISVLTSFQAWQLQFFGCTNCSEAQGETDSDGDGMSNTNEFLSGTNPTNSLSTLRIVSTVRQGDDVVITWTTAGGHTNRVQASAGDVDSGYTNDFVDISGPIDIDGSGDVTTNYVDEGGITNVTSRYYRIRVMP